MDHSNTERPAAAAMAVAGQDAQIHPSPALKTYHFQWSGFMMMWEENIGCTGRVSPLQLQVTYINITLTTLICPLQPRTKTSAVGPRETQGPTMVTTHTHTPSCIQALVSSVGTHWQKYQQFWYNTYLVYVSFDK